MKTGSRGHQVWLAIVGIFICCIFFSIGEQAQAGTLTGFVKAEGTLAGIQSVSVQVFRSNYCPQPFSPFMSALTDSTGAYTLNGLSAGRYKVYYSTQSITTPYTSEWYDNQTTFLQAAEIEVSDPGTTTLNDAILAQGGSISGKITEEGTSTGIVGVSIWVYDSANQSSIVKTTYSNPDGTYTVTGLPAGSYKLRFTNTGNYVGEWYDNKSNFSGATMVPVTAGAVTPNINAQLAPGGSISGLVTQEGTSIGIAWVMVYVNDGTTNATIQSVNTGSDGSYTVSGLPAGSYKLRFGTSSPVNYIGEWYNNQASSNTATPVTVTAGAVTPNINAQLAPGGSISGLVTQEGTSTGIAGVSVTVYNGTTYIQSVGTGSDGSYTVSGLPTGSYKLKFSSNLNYIGEWYNNQADNISATPVPVTAGAVTADINAQLAPGGSISGKITQEGNGVVIPCIEIMVNDMTGNYIKSGSTNSNGDYTVTGLPAGSYKIFFLSWNSFYMTEWYDNQGSRNTATPVPVTVGAVTPNINAQLAVGGSFSGTITDGNGQGIFSQIKVYDSTTHNSPGNLSCGYSSINYKCFGLPAGSYKVLFNPSGNYLGEWYDNQNNIDTATPVQIIVGNDTPNINAQLDFGIFLPLITK